ncbi:MAG: Plug domain-containing protein, partial [Saprospiraceae bacterium]|nr:Plug domain-containing protein [Saprospiraceae bacterium]
MLTRYLNHFNMKQLSLLLVVLVHFASVKAQIIEQIDSTDVSKAVVWKKEVVITAQRQQHADFEMPVVTTVLDAGYLKKRLPRSVPEALFGTPGIFVQKTNHGGGSPFLRGLTGQQILMLVDGIRLNNATFRSGPNQYLNTIDPSWLYRVEILESSGAAEYGSDAIGGVI